MEEKGIQVRVVFLSYTVHYIISLGPCLDCDVSQSYDF